MIKSVALILTAVGLVLLGRLDRDGRIAQADTAARALGYEIRVEVTVVRVPQPCTEADSLAPHPSAGEEATCE